MPPVAAVDELRTEELEPLERTDVPADDPEERTVPLAALPERTVPEEEEPLHVRIYDSRGREVREECMHQGVYLFHYQQGERSWTEKRLIR